MAASDYETFLRTTVSANTNVPANLLDARTLDKMLEVVPLLGECDTLEAAPILALYDRFSQGWLTAGVLWLATVLTIALLMSMVGAVLVVTGQALMPQLVSWADQLADGLSGGPLMVLMGIVGVGIAVLIFNFAGLRRWLMNSTRTFSRRIQLRLLLLQAIRAQVDRNRGIIDNNWAGAVCRACLARYERYRVRFAYWRWISFGRCRKCHGDRHCYTRVRKIAGWLDHAMSASQEQAGDVVKINMLHRLPPRSLSLPIDLEELVIAHAEDEDVETLILLYRSNQPRTDLPKPKRLRCRLTRNSTVSQMGRRQLKQNFSLRSTTKGFS